MSNKENLKVGDKFWYKDSYNNIHSSVVMGKTPKGYKITNNGSVFVIEYNKVVNEPLPTKGVKENISEEETTDDDSVIDYDYEKDVVNLYILYVKQNYGIDLPNLTMTEIIEMMKGYETMTEINELTKTIETYTERGQTKLVEWLKELKKYKLNG